jgi:hypothetical protein
MPLGPYNWQFDDFLTASRLNGELRRTNGQPFLGNGVGWHAQRPLYKSHLTPGTPLPFTANTWEQQYNTQIIGGQGAWTPVVDTAAFLGGRGDLAAAGAYQPSGLTAGGGAATATGGLGLFWSYQPLTTNATGTGAAGIGTVGTGSPFMVGTQHPNNGNNFGVTPWAAAIGDHGQQNLTGYYYGATAPAAYSGTLNDGSGAPPRQMGFWASVYRANGATVGAIPTITTGYTPTSALTQTGMNANIQQTMNLLNMPPLLSVKAAGGTSCPINTNTPIIYPAATYDTYAGFNQSTGVYTVPLSGLYLVMAFAGFDSPGAGRIRTGVFINGSSNVYNGPISQTLAGAACNTSKVQIFSLNAGDTIQHFVFQANTSPLTTSTFNEPNMHIVYLGAQGAPNPLPSVPDFTYLFAAGTPGSQMPGILNSHLANDLQFLLQRPYCMAYQSTAQAAFGNASTTALQLQTNQGMVHGDTANNYGGWNGSTTYTAPRNGWYLCVQEFFMAAMNANDYVTGAFLVTPAGALGPDYYEQKIAWTGTGGGASAMGLYYLRSGDSISPAAYWRGHTGTVATDISVGKSHFEAVWMSA